MIRMELSRQNVASSHNHQPSLGSVNPDGGRLDISISAPQPDGTWVSLHWVPMTGQLDAAGGDPVSNPLMPHARKSEAIFFFK